MRTTPFLSLFLLLAVLCFSAQSADTREFAALVVSVADGDTITVLTQNKQQVKIRLYGIDCPEKGQAFGNRAKQTASEAVHGKNVTVLAMDTDRYGRTVAIVFMPDGKSLNAHLVREGMAWVYPQYCKRNDICRPLRELEQAARASKRGLWLDKNPMTPWEWRKLRRGK